MCIFPIMKKAWSLAEDARLKQLVEALLKEEPNPYTPDGFSPRSVLWKKIQMPSRTPGAMQGRWVCHISPHTIKDEWTRVEDELLMKSVREVSRGSMGWSKRACWLAEKMDIAPPNRRGGGDVCSRYFLLLENQRKKVENEGPKEVDEEIKEEIKEESEEIKEENEGTKEENEVKKIRNVRRSKRLSTGDIKAN